MWKTLRKWTTSSQTSRTAAKGDSRPFAPGFETLQDRVVPSVYVSGGHLIIYGTAGDDVVSVSQVGSSYRVSELVTNAYMPKTKITDIPVAHITGQISFRGNDGNDIFTNATARQSFAYGGNGNDLLIGGSNNDKLYGEAGNDTLRGMYGSDELYGGDGNDLIYALGISGGSEVNSNHLDGGNGDDVLAGSDGNDGLIGGAGADSLYGYYGNDVLVGGTGKDRLYGGFGDDYLNGDPGDGVEDFLHGGAGSDHFVYGFVSQDTVVPHYTPGYQVDQPADRELQDTFEVVRFTDRSFW
jgi:Ca2+-binding RTX toxin-like protein